MTVITLFISLNPGFKYRFYELILVVTELCS
jgi:hypothetical protein